MEVGDGIATGEIVDRGLITHGSAIMEASLVESGCAVILHDIDLAATRPRGVNNIGSHHPERRPHTDAGGEFGAPFDPPVRKPEFGLGFHAGGSECKSIGCLVLRS